MVKKPIRPAYYRLRGQAAEGDGSAAAAPPEVPPEVPAEVPADPPATVAPEPPADPKWPLALGTFGGFPIVYRAGTTDEDVLAHSFEHDIFLTGVPEYRPSPGDVVVDVGAHIGTFSVLVAPQVPEGRVYAVEACRDSYMLCRANTALNRLDNVDVSHLALSDRQGTCTLYYDVGNWGHSIVAEFGGQGETVPTDTLERFMREKGIARCDFVKFNCEGAEFPILLSTPRDVLQRVGTMLVLYHCDLYTEPAPEALLAQLLDHLGGAGFDTTVRQRTERRGWIIATRPARPEGARVTSAPRQR